MRPLDYRQVMIVELLSFLVPVEEQAEWLRYEEAHWTRFLELQPGFIAKQVWRGTDVDGAEPADATRILVTIWWQSIDAWKSIPESSLQEVIEAMGEHERHAVCHAYDVVSAPGGVPGTGVSP